MQIFKTVMKEQNFKIFSILLLIISSCCTKVHSCFEQNNYSTLCLLREKNTSFCGILWRFLSLIIIFQHKLLHLLSKYGCFSALMVHVQENSKQVSGLAGQHRIQIYEVRIR